MAEMRSKLAGFNVKPSEYKRIKKVAISLNMRMSEFMRETVMKEVAKEEKKNANTK